MTDPNPAQTTTNTTQAPTATTASAAKLAPSTDELPERILADIGTPGGPLLLVTFEVHGNEPAGRKAVERIAHFFSEHGAPVLAGRLVAVCGNRRAVASDLRFIDRDLNRVFPSETASESTGPAMPRSAEHQERDELIELIRKLKSEHSKSPLWFADLHTTSSESIPYLSLPDDGADILTFATELPLHHVTGFAQIVGGTIDRYLHEQGFIGFACEGGSHDGPGSISNMEALIWILLDQTGILRHSDDGSPHPQVAESRLLLEKFLIRGASHFRISHRHGITPADKFTMEPGFANFHEVHKGQLLAHDRNGPVPSPSDAHLLMPLYQPEGDDGFFLVEEQVEGK